jgi:hypothetical protein
LTWMSYSGRWNASGQIPLREVEAGRLDRFGSIDPTEGGATERQSLSLRLAGGEDDARFEVLVYGIRYDFRLFSNFTFFLHDPVFGDQIEQTDDRGVLGGDARATFRHEAGPVGLATTVGIQGRADHIDGGLYHTVQRERLGTTDSATTSETSGGVFVDELARFLPWLALRGGLRIDRFDASVDDRLEDTSTLRSGRSGTAGALLVSPKGSLILSPSRMVDLFVNVGRGFHSNDARGAARSISPASLLAAAMGYEVGTRVRPVEPLTATLAVYRLDLDSEQVYVGDEGTTEPSARSMRYGVETTATLALGRWLSADGAVTLNRAVYRGNAGNAGAVALAPTRTITGGVSAHASWGSFASLRVRHVGQRPATPDGRLVAEGWTVLSARAGHRQGPIEIAADVNNLLNTTWREVQFATESRLRGEPAPVEEIHFTPGWPFSAQVTASAYF